MTPRRHAATAARLGAALLLVGAACAVSAGGAGAATLPVPAPTALTDPLEGTAPGEALTGAQEGVEGTVSGMVGTSAPATTPTSEEGAAAAPTTASSPAPASKPAPSRSTGASPRSAATDTRSTTPPASAASSSPAAVRADTSDASVCLIPTGGASPAFEVGAKIGQDLLSPLVRQFPQAFAACPPGAVRADGGNLVAADATVQGLLGACVRVTRQVTPLQTTLVVLDHDLVRELTAAGVPLDQLVEPCPETAGAVGAQHGSASPSAGDELAGSSADGTATALATRLAFTGAEPGPVLFAAVVLLCGGAVAVRKARLLAAAARG